MVTAFVLTGCDLFPRDVDAYLNKSVCTITYTDKTKEEITTEAFINAYNSYGSSLTQNGSTQEDAVNKTLDVLISRYVLLNHAKKTVSIDDDMEDVYDEVYTSLESSISSYVTAVKTEVIVHSSTFLCLQLLLNPQHAQFGRHFFRLVLLEFA